MNWKVLGIESNLGWPVDKVAYAKLGAEYIQRPCQTEHEILQAVSDADAVFAVTVYFSRKIIECMKRCRVISVVGIGYDHVDINSATEYGICVSNVPGYCVEEVSDHAMALLLACARKTVMQVIGVRAGEWDSTVNSKIWARLTPMFRLKGQTLGLIGLGRIGQTLIPKATGFGIKVIAHDPYVTPSLARKMGVELVKLDYLLAKSDFISLHMPLTEETRRMFGLEQFKRMKPSAFLINCGRGGLVDENALYTAVTQGYIAGAGLDVAETEPLAPNNPLLKLDSVLITPHSAFYSEQSMNEVIKQAEEQVFEVLSGKWPRNFVNPAVKDQYTRRWK